MTVHIGKDEYEILSLAGDKVELFDGTLIPLEMELDTFLKRIRENPLNDGLLKEPRPAPKVEFKEEKPKSGTPPKQTRKGKKNEPSVDALVAKMEDGSIVKGESHIPEAGKKIIELSCEPKNCKPSQDVIEAINNADLIVLGPGSLYTSITPNLLVKEISSAILNSKAKKIYVCNIMTQPGETDNYSAADHAEVLFKHAKLVTGIVDKKLFDAILINNFMPQNLAKKYEEADSLPVEIDTSRIKKMGLEIVMNKLIEDNKEGLVRHSPSRLAKSIYWW